MTDITCAGETLTLLPERAVFRPKRKCLLLADLHLGKEQVFGRAGIPIPGGISEHVIAQLDALVNRMRPEQLIILGDLMHAIPHTDERWLHRLGVFLHAHEELTVSVCAGNHDRQQGQQRIDRRINWHQEPILDPPFVMQHHPGNDVRGYVLAGHVHPAYRIGRSRRQGLRLPAFWFRPGHAVLPAFGDFTGGENIRPSPEDRLFVAAPERVLPVPMSGKRATPAG